MRLESSAVVWSSHGEVAVWQMQLIPEASENAVLQSGWGKQENIMGRRLAKASDPLSQRADLRVLWGMCSHAPPAMATLFSE